MLILTRRKNEIVKIGDDITVSFLGLNSYGSAKFGFEAPESVYIRRGGVYAPETNADGNNADVPTLKLDVYRIDDKVYGVSKLTKKVYTLESCNNCEASEVLKIIRDKQL